MLLWCSQSFFVSLHLLCKYHNAVRVINLRCIPKKVLYFLISTWKKYQILIFCKHDIPHAAGHLTTSCIGNMKYACQEIIKIAQSFFKLQSIMLGCFSGTPCETKCKFQNKTVSVRRTYYLGDICTELFYETVAPTWFQLLLRHFWQYEIFRNFTRWHSW